MSTILLIEPDSLLAHSYQIALEAAGHSVMKATGGQAAIELADSSTPEVIILELQLPGHNGLEFLYEFRSYPEWAHVPVIINSFTPRGLATMSPQLLTELGIFATLYKPRTTLVQLRRCVQEAMRETKTRGSVAKVSPGQVVILPDGSA